MYCTLIQNICGTIYSYRSQSTVTINVISETGRLTDVSTMIIVTRPAEGIAAAPMLASVAVRLYL